MSDEKTTGRGSKFDRDDDRDPGRTGEALREILGNEVKFRYPALALVAAVVWWLALDPISALAAGLGFVILAFVTDPIVGMLTTTRWATTEGTVLESTVLTRRQAMERADMDLSGDRSVAGYVSLVRYRYDVDGTTYENARVSPFDASTSRRGWAEALVDRYPRNAWREVRYHPGDPTRSYLQVWTKASRVDVIALIGLFLLTLAVTVAIGINTGYQAPFGLVPLAFGLTIALLELYGVKRAIQTARWPTATGVVTATNVKAIAGTEARGSGGYRMEIIYEYEIDGETYVSERSSPGNSSLKESRSAAEAWLEEHYPIGSEVALLYDPDRPDDTVSNKGGAASAFVWFLMGLALCGLGSHLLLHPGLVSPSMVEELIARLLGRIP